MTDYSLAKGDGAALLDILDEVTELYLAIRGDLPNADAGIYRRDAFLARTRSQAARGSFSATWARADTGELVGFAFGLPFPSRGWWSGNPTLPPAEILDSEKFAVIELDVSPAWRGRGVGRQLLDLLLQGRPEPFAILTTTPDRPARKMYERWGWEQVGTAQHTPDAPVMDQMVLRLA